jgi:succinate dehydrogenase / fumarate reductase cytochrome b subunit
MASRARPLSPHLQIFKPHLLMTMSIVHRATGVALTFAALLLTWGLVAVASGPDAYADFLQFMRSIVGRLIVAGFVLSMIYHLLNGLRHLAWDTGWGLELTRAYATGWLVVVLTPLLSALVLWCAWA